MAEWQGYFYIEVLSLTAQQKQTLVTALKSLGLRNLSIHPQERNHWRVRTDSNALIFEAVFNSDLLTVAALKTRLATLFGVSESLIIPTTSSNIYGEIVVFKYSNVDRLRVGVFGGRSAVYQASRAAAQRYLIDFNSLWKGV